MADIDLQKFCGSESYRPQLFTPFSQGSYTWATDGRIMVRVPRQDGVAERADAPDAARVWLEGDIPMVPVLPKRLPNPAMARCRDCDGRGYKHTCPDCQCKCESCNGSGRVNGDAAVSVGERHMMDLKYARLMLELPSLQIDPEPGDYRMRFRFDGGEGLICLLRASHGMDVVTDLLSGEPA